MLMLNQLMGFGAAPHRIKPATSTFLTQDATGTDATNFSFPGVNLDNPDAETWYVLFAWAIRAGAIAGVSASIAGVAADILTQSDGVSNPDSGSFMAIAKVPAGTSSGAIAATFNQTYTRGGYGLWKAKGLWSPAARDVISVDGIDPLTGTIDVLAGGLLFGGAVVNGGTSFAWTGASENFDTTVDGGASTHSGASAEIVAAQTGLTLTADQAGGTLGTSALVAVSLR